MAPFSIPTPSIIPLRIPIFGGSKSIDTKTKIQILCETYLEHEIFYTLDGTKPQPYAGIVQGNKTIKYTSPICLPAGKITIKAIAINSVAYTMCSSVVTKCFDVVKIESDDNNSKPRKQKILKPKDTVVCGIKQNSNEKISVKDEKLPGTSHEKVECDLIQENNSNTNCLEEAFIGSSDFELESCCEDDAEDGNCDDTLDINDNITSLKTIKGIAEDPCCEDDSITGAIEKMTIDRDKNMDQANTTLTDSGTSIGTQFCCLKCDLTLQQCNNCNKMNAVSSKFCIGCGEQLLQKCYVCKEWNLIVATFCQFCGKKIGTRMESFLRLDQADQSVMVRPESKDVSVQTLPKKTDKGTQTTHDRNAAKRSSSASRRMPSVSPGGGYWHQQLDYICNHLKSYAYNNVNFRKEISEPSLCDFKSANITKENNSIVVTLSFTPYVPGKSNLPTTEDAKIEDNSKSS